MTSGLSLDFSCSCNSGAAADKLWSRDTPPTPSRSTVRRQLVFMSSIFKGETFYLDLNGHQDAPSIEQDILSLGGSVEKFLSKDIKCVVTNKRKPRGGWTVNTESPRTPPSANATNSLPSQDSFCTPASRSFNSPLALSRGQALLLKSNKKKPTASSPVTDVLSRAGEWGIKIVQVNEILRKINREKKNCKLVEDRDGSSTKEAHRNSLKPRELKAPFIKFEDDSQSYKVNYKQFSTLPVVYVPGENASERDWTQCGSPFEPEVSHQQPETAAASVESKAAVHIKNQPRKPVPAQLSGYCESCNARYQHLKQHFNSKMHRDFVDNKENFSELDATISKLPTIVDFIAQLSLDSSQSQHEELVALPHQDARIGNGIHSDKNKRCPEEEAVAESGNDQAMLPKDTPSENQVLDCKLAHETNCDALSEQTCAPSLRHHDGDRDIIAARCPNPVTGHHAPLVSALRGNITSPVSEPLSGMPTLSPSIGSNPATHAQAGSADMPVLDSYSPTHVVPTGQSHLKSDNQVSVDPAYERLHRKQNVEPKTSIVPPQSNLETCHVKVKPKVDFRDITTLCNSSPTGVVATAPASLSESTNQEARGLNSNKVDNNKELPPKLPSEKLRSVIDSIAAGVLSTKNGQDEPLDLSVRPFHGAKEPAKKLAPSVIRHNDNLLAADVHNGDTFDGIKHFQDMKLNANNAETIASQKEDQFVARPESHVRHFERVASEMTDVATSSDENWDIKLRARCNSIIKALDKDLHPNTLGQQVNGQTPKDNSENDKNPTAVIEMFKEQSHEKTELIDVVEFKPVCQPQVPLPPVFSHCPALNDAIAESDVMQQYRHHSISQTGLQRRDQVEAQSLDFLAKEFDAKAQISTEEYNPAVDIVPASFQTPFMTSFVCTIPVISLPRTTRKKGKSKRKWHLKVQVAPAKFIAPPSFSGTGLSAENLKELESYSDCPTESSELSVGATGNVSQVVTSSDPIINKVKKKSSKKTKASKHKLLPDDFFNTSLDGGANVDKSVALKVPKTPKSVMFKTENDFVVSVSDELTPPSETKVTFKQKTPQSTNAADFEWRVQKSGDCKLTFSLNRINSSQTQKKGSKGSSRKKLF